jgi:hypothetical protein
MVASVLASLLELVLRWLGLFAAPFHNFELLWIIIPIYLGWIFSEFYEEKIGTSFGKAITNGAVLIWVGIDWTRTTTGLLGTTSTASIILKYSLCVISVLLGVLIIFFGIRRKKIIKFLGRSRNTTYYALMFTPIVYNVVQMSWETIVVIILFFPVYYLIIEIINRIVPNPKIYEEEQKNE